MAQNFPVFLPEQADCLDIFADSDSENEFEGYTLNDVDENRERNQNLDMGIEPEDWIEGCTDKEPVQFTAVPGLKVQLPESPCLLDFLSLYIKDGDYQIMADQTNIYADQYFRSREAPLPPNSRFNKWMDTNANEMKVFVGIVLAMGLVNQADIKEYWTTDPVTSTPFFPSCMPRDRFQLLLSFLHLNDNSNYIPRGQEGHDPLFKLGSIYSNILRRFSSSYTSYKYLSFDEGMIPWRGNLSFRVYNPDKPIKYGIKAYMLCDSTNGYVNKFRLYTGKTNIPASGAGATYDLVMDMMTPGYLNQGYTLYCDNYYTSPRLFWDLWLLGVCATGTLRKTRVGVPQAIKDKKLERKGDTYVMTNGPLSVIKYLDGNYVFMLTTVDNIDPIPTRNRDQDGNIVSRPHAVVQYDRYMGGVDRADQMISYHQVLGSVKWWKKVFFYTISVAVVNAYIIYKEVTTTRPLLLQRIFRRDLIKELVTSAGMPTYRAAGRPSAQVLDRLQGRHFPTKISENGNGKAYPKSCTVCSKAERDNQQGQKRKHAGHTTSYCCKQCGVALCIVPCFELFHTKQEYVLAYKRLKATEE